MDNTFDRILDFIAPKIATTLFMIDASLKPQINEIRLRVNMPISLNICGENLFLSQSGKLTKEITETLVTAEKGDIDESFLLVCNHSVYSHSEEISESYITVSGGYRVGITGETVEAGGRITAFKNVMSLNYRIPHDAEFHFDNFYNFLTSSRGVLFCGPPSSGKTTAIRQAVRTLSSGAEGSPKRVSVIDSRNEISATSGGIPQNDLGKTSDIVISKNSAAAIKNAIRVMNPEFIVLDEIMSESEIEGVIFGTRCGVKMILSIHIGYKNEIREKKFIKRLVHDEVVNKAVYLKYAGAIPEIIDLEV